MRVWASLLVFSLSTACFAVTSDEKLTACDAALYAKVREADLCNLGVKIRDDELQRVTKENAALRASATAWYNNPAVWAAIGVIAGTYVGARATR